MTTFTYTGDVQTYVVPSDVYSVLIECWGAQGGEAGGGSGEPGTGGYASGVLNVTPGETLNVFVGGQGGTGPGGWNGGGDSGARVGDAGGGGGGSDVRQGGTAASNRVIVGGGGGGQGKFTGTNGGDGGGTSGVDGEVHATSDVHGDPGLGGSQSSGGSGGDGGVHDNNGSPGGSGSLISGGNGGSGSSSGHDGGGAGGGYYGGGGGGGGGHGSSAIGTGGNAGGGSGYVGGVSGGTLTVGGRTGHGQVVVTVDNTAPSAPGDFTAPTSTSEWTGTNTIDWGASSDPEGDPVTYQLQYSGDNGSSWSTLASGISGTTYDYNFDNEASTTAAKLRVRAYDGEVYGAWTESDTFTVEHNEPPNAPTLTNPVNGATIDRATTERFTWDFSDPDTGDSQSKYDLQIRPQGSSTNTVDTSGTTTNEYHDLPSGTLTDGDYEWRVRTYDEKGEVGPWSGWEPFTAATQPDPPTIVDPTSGQTISTEEYVVEWSTPNQSSYQLRRVADDAGNPDTSIVYSDTGEVVTATDRDRVVAFPENNRWEHIQVRVKYDGLWSDWSSVRVEISYTTPATPTISLVEEDSSGRIVANVTNPTPSGGQPSVTSNDILRRRQGEEEWERIATGISKNGSYNDYTPQSGQGYEYRTRALGDNGTSSYSDATSSPGLVLRGSWIHDPADPAATIHQFIYNAEGGTDTWEPEVELRQYAGRVLPVAEYGEHESLIIDLELALDDKKNETEIIRSLAGRKAPLCYRDASGRKAFVIIPSLPRGHRFFGAESSVSLQAIDYDEAV